MHSCRCERGMEVILTYSCIEVVSKLWEMFLNMLNLKWAMPYLKTYCFAGMEKLSPRRKDGRGTQSLHAPGG